MNWLDLPVGEHVPETVNAVVEVPYGCTNKYEYDERLNLFRLDRPLYASVHYPGEYGFIPGTRSADGDPLDILILATHGTFPGCLVEARPIGVLKMFDQGVPDQKILAVGKSNPTYAEVRSHEDVAHHILREIEHFYSIYKELEGKHTEVRGWEGTTAAQNLIREGERRYHEHGAGKAGAT